MIDSSVDYKYLPRPTWAEIDIDAVLNNINEYKKALGDKVMLPHTMRLILFAWLPTLIITTYVPDLSLFLPRLFGYC